MKSNKWIEVDGEMPEPPDGVLSELFTFRFRFEPWNPAIETAESYDRRATAAFEKYLAEWFKENEPRMRRFRELVEKKIEESKEL